MLSPKARAVADKIKSFDESDINSIADMIHHEVAHVTDVVSERARAAEARVKQLADQAGAAGRQITKTVDDNPLQSTLVALGVGFVLGMLLTAGSRR